MDSNALPPSPPQPQPQQQQQLQAVITFAMPPGPTPGVVNVASASNQLSLTSNLLDTVNSKDKHVQALTVFVRVSMALMICGVGNVVFGGIILISEFISMPSLGLSSLGLAGVWSGFVFSVINGALAIKSATLKPHIPQPWAWVNLGFGIAAIFVHLASLIYTFFNIMNAEANVSYDYKNWRENSYLNVKYASDGARVVAFIVLLIVDICRLVAVSIALSLLRKFPRASTSTPTATSTSTPAPAPAPTEVSRQASLLEPTATLSEDYTAPLISSAP